MAKTGLFVPDKIKVGFQKDKSTFTKKKSFVIYFDEYGVLRQEKSWNDWRDHSIPTEEHENKPISGFVINKNVGGVEHSYGRNPRKTWIRVYDPRGFEVEIDVENLLTILKDTDCLAGGILEGEFVYAWFGASRVLLSMRW